MKTASTTKDLSPCFGSCTTTWTRPCSMPTAGPTTSATNKILERLVALNGERAAEEKRGFVRWLRPKFQNPQGAKPVRPTIQESLADTEDDDSDKPAAKSAPGAAVTAWPKKLPERIAAVRDLVAHTGDTWTLDRVCAAFKGAKKAEGDVGEVLESLEALGMLTGYQAGGVRRWKLSLNRPVGERLDQSVGRLTRIAGADVCRMAASSCRVVLHTFARRQGHP